VTDLVDPLSVLARQKAALGNEESCQRRPPRPPPVKLRDRGLGPVNGLGGSFQIDPRPRQVQPQCRAPVHRICAENAPQLRHQRVEPAVDRCGIGLAPQGLGHLVAGDLPVPVDDQVGEQQPALASRQAGI
jgi:hypothetical protein